jgi:hypothetical protein
MNTATDSLETNSPKSGGGFQVGQSSSDLVGFWGKAPCDQPAALTAQLTTLTIADAAGTPDYAQAAFTTTTPAGFASIQEAITFAYVVQNLQVRLAEVEARLEECGIVTAN